MGARSAATGRVASPADVEACELAGETVRRFGWVSPPPDPLSGACLLHAPSTTHKTEQTAAVTLDCHRLLCAAAHKGVGVGVWVSEAGPRVIR